MTYSSSYRLPTLHPTNGLAAAAEGPSGGRLPPPPATPPDAVTGPEPPGTSLSSPRPPDGANCPQHHTVQRNEGAGSSSEQDNSVNPAIAQTTPNYDCQPWPSHTPAPNNNNNTSLQKTLVRNTTRTRHAHQTKPARILSHIPAIPGPFNAPAMLQRVREWLLGCRLRGLWCWRRMTGRPVVQSLLRLYATVPLQAAVPPRCEHAWCRAVRCRRRQ